MHWSVSLRCSSVGAVFWLFSVVRTCWRSSYALVMSCVVCLSRSLLVLSSVPKVCMFAMVAGAVPRSVSPMCPANASA